jgi:hypothetical protein
MSAAAPFEGVELQHRFGLDLAAEDERALVAFLKTL